MHDIRFLPCKPRVNPATGRDGIGLAGWEGREGYTVVCDEEPISIDSHSGIGQGTTGQQEQQVYKESSRGACRAERKQHRQGRERTGNEAQHWRQLPGWPRQWSYPGSEAILALAPRVTRVGLDVGVAARPLLRLLAHNPVPRAALEQGPTVAGQGMLRDEGWSR